MSNLQELINQYVKIALDHESALNRGNYKLGNKKISSASKFAIKLRSSKQGKDALAHLMSHESESVRYFAAADSLPFDSQRAKDILKEIKENGSALYRALSYATLDLWDEGKLNFDSESTEDENNDDEGIDLEIFHRIVTSKHMDHEEEYIKSLSSGMKMVYSTLKLEIDLQNGGFNQYFLNCLPDDTKLAREGYNLIGATSFVEILDEAVKTFMDELPHTKKYLKDPISNSFAESYKRSSLDKLDSKFEELYKKEDPSILRTKYISAHIGEFKLSN